VVLHLCICHACSTAQKGYSTLQQPDIVAAQTIRFILLTHKAEDNTLMHQQQSALWFSSSTYILEKTPRVSGPDFYRIGAVASLPVIKKLTETQEYSSQLRKIILILSLSATGLSRKRVLVSLCLLVNTNT